MKGEWAHHLANELVVLLFASTTSIIVPVRPFVSRCTRVNRTDKDVASICNVWTFCSPFLDQNTHASPENGRNSPKKSGLVGASRFVITILFFKNRNKKEVHDEMGITVMIVW
ncbi:hypothetical protein ACFX2I_001073 [Malus domestica]